MSTRKKIAALVLVFSLWMPVCSWALNSEASPDGQPVHFQTIQADDPAFERSPSQDPLYIASVERVVETRNEGSIGAYVARFLVWLHPLVM